MTPQVPPPGAADEAVGALDRLIAFKSWWASVDAPEHGIAPDVKAQALVAAAKAELAALREENTRLREIAYSMSARHRALGCGIKYVLNRCGSVDAVKEVLNEYLRDDEETARTEKERAAAVRAALPRDEKEGG